MRQIFAFSILAIINVIICQNNSTQQIQKIFDDQGIHTIYYNNTFKLTGLNNANIVFSLENMTIMDSFLIEGNDLSFTFSEFTLRNVSIGLNNQSLFVLSQTKSFVINNMKLENIEIFTPIFSVNYLEGFSIERGQIINSYLEKGFGSFQEVQSFIIKQSIVDIDTIQNLNEPFYKLNNTKMFHFENCKFGILSRNSLNKDQQKEVYLTEKEQSKQNIPSFIQNQKYLNFIEVYGNKKLYQGSESYLKFIQADFNNTNIRFLLISSQIEQKIIIQFCQFANMKSVSSGGCISNLGVAMLEFTKTIFDTCQSQMFGGAIYSANLNVTDELIVQNCKSKIGGGAFLGLRAEDKMLLDAEKIKFINNKATVSSQQYFACTNQIDSFQMPHCNLFEIDSLFQLNTELVNTQYYMVQQQINIEKLVTPPYIIYHMSLQQNMIYLIRLKVEYKCAEQKQLCSVSEFDEFQSIGNLYDFIEDNLKQYFYNFNLPNVNYPYLLTSYFEYFDCINSYIDLFELQFFQIHFYYKNSRFGCYNPTNNCQKGMEQVLNVQKQQIQCKYCSFGSYSGDPQNNCAICETEKFDKCYADVSYLKQNLWRPQNSQFSETYLCELNQQSCNGEKRYGSGNELCLEGYIGPQCLTCDINGEYWNGESYGLQGYFQCAKCSTLQNNTLFNYLSAAFSLFLFFFTVRGSFKRMQNQIYRRYLSFYMKRIYIGYSFIRQNQSSVYTKILLFNFQMYLLTYYFVDFNHYDYSIHSRIYSFFNPLQNQGGTSYDCFLKQYFDKAESLGYIKLLISIMSPLVLNFCFLIFIGIFSCIRKKNYFFIIISSFTYSIIFVFQQSIISYSIESFTCIQLTQKDQYLMIDTSINCSNQHMMNSMKYLSIPALIIYVFALPIALFGYIYANRSNLEKTKILIIFGFMYDEYKRRYFYWQFIKLILSTLLSALVSLGKAQIVLSCLIYCAILSVYSASVIYFQPFQQVFINKVELVSNILSVLYVISSICLQIEFDSQNQYDSYKLGRIISEIFYYLVLFLQMIFYIYITVLIIGSVFYTSIQGIRRKRFFQRIIRLFPSLKLYIYSKQLEINLQKFRMVVRNCIINQSFQPINELGENQALINNCVNSFSDTQIIHHQKLLQ
ncbi:transmembrane protein, putative (macronuclear) [Tetrahymena thermophila SB210]|uniref:Transmembrane protein, putative n=1 Tax=Tetrahymena thermophila (strain SB210) TaxID=312017 RepID=Q23ZB1_TETTS|nr:transmembrane protein, putative [Tetrahymena thermophila SB210]EAS01860.2 transmembrane protein, putative [Tetrahymena thermophila SB210]|eukprot:XP_001022105.2 transmembrane protein, putative [Tetrahymena thermophila SB210]